MQREVWGAAFLGIWAFIMTISIGTVRTAEAVRIAFDPAEISAVAGESLEVDLVISELEGIDLGAFDIDVHYDAEALRFESYVLGPGLAAPGTGHDDKSSGQVGALHAGLLHFAEVATLTDFNAQPDEFVLATLTFTALADTGEKLTINNPVLNDPVDTGLDFDITLAPGADVTVVESTSGKDVPAPPATPEPATIFLLGIGFLAAALGLRKKTKSKRR